jgi:hypothetical protein
MKEFQIEIFYYINNLISFLKQKHLYNTNYFLGRINLIIKLKIILFPNIWENYFYNILLRDTGWE